MIDSIVKVVTGIVRLRGGTDGTVVGNFSDRLKIDPGYGSLATYAACASAFVPAASATDVFTIQGSATKTIKITKITVTGTTTSGSGIAVNLSLIKRSTANTGGTSATVTPVTYDSTNASSTAVVKSYTANPSALGTIVGTVHADRHNIVTQGLLQNHITWIFGERASQALVLRGSSEYLAVNLGSVSVTGPVFSICVEYTEE